MFRPQAQAETHSTAQGPLHTSRTTQAEASGGPRRLLCASAHGGREPRRASPGLLCVSACACGLNINKKNKILL